MRQTLVQQVGLVVCQGCCCGRDRPDRSAALRDFCAGRPDTVRLLETGCLNRCDYADVVVVRPSPEGRRRGGRPTWFGFADDHAVDRLREWIDAGGPGVADLPDDLALHEISRPWKAD